MNYVDLSHWIISGLCGKSTKNMSIFVLKYRNFRHITYNNVMAKKYISGIYSPINPQWNKGHKSPDINGKNRYNII